MDIVNRNVYYMKVMTAYIVNTESSDDYEGSTRVQVYIPEAQDPLSFRSYGGTTGSKKDNPDFNKYPWAFSTLSDPTNLDLVYVANLSNDVGNYVIIGRDASCGGTAGGAGGIGGGDLDSGGLAELLIPFIIKAETGCGKKPLYDDYWDKNVEVPCKSFTTSTSSSWSVGLLNWDAGRAWSLMYDIACQDSNWERHFSDKSQAFVTNMKYDVATKNCRSGNSAIVNSGRTSVQSVINGIKAMASSPIGQEVQKKKAREDVSSKYIQLLMDKGVTNPAILILLGDIWNQYGSRYSLLDEAQNPSTKEVKDYQANTMMQQFEWFVDKAKADLGSQWDLYGKGTFEGISRRSACAAYIRELYKQGRLSGLIAGLTQRGDFIISTLNGLTLSFPFKGNITDIVGTTDTYSAINAAGNGAAPVTYTINSIKGHHVTSLFGARWLTVNGKSYKSEHNGIDFGAAKGTVLYASHDGTLTVADNSRGIWALCYHII